MCVYARARETDGKRLERTGGERVRNVVSLLLDVEHERRVLRPTDRRRALTAALPGVLTDSARLGMARRRRGGDTNLPRWRGEGRPCQLLHSRSHRLRAHLESRTTTRWSQPAS